MFAQAHSVSAYDRKNIFLWCDGFNENIAPGNLSMYTDPTGENPVLAAEEAYALGAALGAAAYASSPALQQALADAADAIGNALNQAANDGPSVPEQLARCERSYNAKLLACELECDEGMKDACKLKALRELQQCTTRATTPPWRQ